MKESQVKKIFKEFVKKDFIIEKEIQNQTDFKLIHKKWGTRCIYYVEAKGEMRTEKKRQARTQNLLMGLGEIIRCARERKNLAMVLPYSYFEEVKKIDKANENWRKVMKIRFLFIKKNKILLLNYSSKKLKPIQKLPITYTKVKEVA